MNNEITVYNQVADPVTAMAAIGNQIMDSGLFGCKTQAQGHILALECMATKLPPLSMAKRYDLIHGKLAMKSQTMLADFRTLGGKSKMLEKSPTRAAIWMKDRDGNEYKFELTWEDAKRETFPYQGKESEILAMLADGVTPALNPKYATPRSRGIMLWNRLISDSVRTIAPEINCGQYTACEIEDFAGPVIEATRQNLDFKQGIDYVGVEEVVVEDAEFNVAPEVIEVEPPVVTEAELVEQSAIEQPPATNNEERNSPIEDPPCTEALDARIKESMGQAKQLGVDDIVPKVKAVLAKSGVSKIMELTTSQANQLLSAIERKELEQWLSEPLKAKATEAKNDTSQS